MNRIEKAILVVVVGLLVGALYQYTGLDYTEYGAWAWIVFGVAIVVSVATPNSWRSICGVAIFGVGLGAAIITHRDTTPLTLHFLLLIIEGIVFGGMCALMRLKEAPHSGVHTYINRHPGFDDL